MDIEIVQAVDNLGPRVAAVEAPEDAVDLDAGPDDSRIVRVDEDAGHEGLSDGALGRDGDVQSLPGCSAVARAIDRGRAGACEERPIIGRVHGERPHRRQVAGGADARP